MANYFTKSTDASIEAFQAATTDKEKHEIFDKEIRPAFEKLIENIIYVYKFFTLGDVDTLKRECLTDLYNVLPKYDVTKIRDVNKPSSSSFSYFNSVTKNWFIARVRENSKKNKNESELYHDLDHEAVRTDPSLIVNSFESLIVGKEKWIEFYKAMDSWRDALRKKNERQVLEAIIFLMKNSEMVTIYNKKAVYLYLRELTGMNTKQIMVSLKKIRGLYLEWCEDYHSDGDPVYETNERELD